jgi:putative ubiquitin-RnfH superfamily antitoxin RatB of RatAB toxin-antitoxin module
MNSIAVEVVYAKTDIQVTRKLVLPAGSTVEAAIRRSGLLDAYPEIELKAAGQGIFGRTASLDTPLRDGDRVEIYRPLAADPTELRRRRAARQLNR